MLFRGDPEGFVAISQPAHAWVSGQLARQWADTRLFEGVQEEVFLAAEQHDVGFLEWERFPELNPATGLPYTFMEMPRLTHLELWSKGIQEMLRFGRYPALLVSKHFTWLAERNGREGPNEENRLMREFLEKQDELQTTMLTSLANDFYYAPHSAPERIQQLQSLVSLWDWLSLMLCHGTAGEKVFAGNGGNGRGGDFKLHPIEPDWSKVAISPWPFRAPSFRIVCEGRHILKSYDDEAAMRKALRGGAPVSVPMELLRR